MKTFLQKIFFISSLALSQLATVSAAIPYQALITPQTFGLNCQNMACLDGKFVSMQDCEYIPFTLNQRITSVDGSITGTVFAVNASRHRINIELPTANLGANLGKDCVLNVNPATACPAAKPKPMCIQCC